MHQVKSCPQCSIGEGIYVTSCNDYGEEFSTCNHCGFIQLITPKYTDGIQVMEVYKTQGNGVTCMRFDEALRLGRGVCENRMDNSTLDDKLEWFDTLVARGVALPEESYITKADGEMVELLRGNIQHIKNSIYPNECYGDWILEGVQNWPNPDDDGL